ncbi:DUF5689 domain-containing protein [Cellulophaga sp. Hel_I_12]|uniref:DUF5689 domain-containing protein n=1 Tax=Cellulophaga sp. Hel_I_12 TaxID=1249972 RepID=UPI0006464383|nr:DUF5689 domain-containing protein [Cellulophaga sp. Hel_I_12]
MNVIHKPSIFFKVQTLLFAISCVLLFLTSCVDSRNFDLPKIDCTSDMIANTTYADVKALYTDQTLQIQTDLILEGYVISSDEAGNFFSVLHFQDTPVNPTSGFQIEIDVRDSHLFYPVGSKILIKLKGLYLGRSKGIYKLGGVFTSFGNASVGRLPASIVQQHIFNSCDETRSIIPTEISLNENLDTYLNTWVALNRLEFVEEELGQPFALDREATQRTLIACDDLEINLLNSGFSDFQAMILPNKSGTVSALLQKENDAYFLVVNNQSDLNFIQERCEDVVDEFTSNRILISEIADPDNDADARFIELYNSDQSPLSLKGWRLNRYTNENTEVSNSLDLSDFVINAQSTLVIAANSLVFEARYGFLPDLVGGSNSAANSNGDDNFVLVDPFGNDIDVFGIIGEDGSGTNHEFEDGRALRKSAIEFGNPTYTFNEWEIYNDTGDSGTINLPQNAPENFTPKIR